MILQINYDAIKV